jgi:hypothetical protein
VSVEAVAASPDLFIEAAIESIARVVSVPAKPLTRRQKLAVPVRRFRQPHLEGDVRVGRRSGDACTRQNAGRLASVTVGETETDPDVTGIADVIVVESWRVSRVRSAHAVGAGIASRAEGRAFMWSAPAAEGQRRTARRKSTSVAPFCEPTALASRPVSPFQSRKNNTFATADPIFALWIVPGGIMTPRQSGRLAGFPSISITTGPASILIHPDACAVPPAVGWIRHGHHRFGGATDRPAARPSV